jgi:hypothetical protein
MVDRYITPMAAACEHEKGIKQTRSVLGMHKGQHRAHKNRYS